MERYSVKLLSAAYADLDEIYGYIAQQLEEPEVAQKLIQALEETIFSLETLPRRGARRRTGAYAAAQYRKLLVENFIIVYRIEEAAQQVVVVTVRHAKSQF